MQIWPESGTMAEAGVAPAPQQQSEMGLGGAAGAPGGGAPGAPGFNSGMIPKVQNAGEITLSRPESIALAALETEEDEAHGLRRARAESGLSDSQIQQLKRRAKAALAKGYTLKGAQFVQRPTAAAAPEEPGLARKALTDRKEQNAAHPLRRADDKKPTPAQKAKTTTEAITGPLAHPDSYRGTHFLQATRQGSGGARVQMMGKPSAGVPDASLLLDDNRLYHTDGYGLPSPSSVSEPEAREDTKETNTQSTLAAMLRRNRRRRG